MRYVYSTNVSLVLHVQLPNYSGMWNKTGDVTLILHSTSIRGNGRPFNITVSLHLYIPMQLHSSSVHVGRTVEIDLSTVPSMVSITMVPHAYTCMISSEHFDRRRVKITPTVV